MATAKTSSAASSSNRSAKAWLLPGGGWTFAGWRGTFASPAWHEQRSRRSLRSAAHFPLPCPGFGST